jgi:hypothetical protein
MKAFILNDFRLLLRHGFVLAYIVIAILYAAVLSALPRAWADVVLPVMAWSDAAFFCFFFAGASVCLDLAQGTFRALFATPLKPVAYIVVKAGNLCVLALAMATVVSTSSRGSDFRFLPLAAGILAAGVPGAMLGATLALRLKTINRFMMGCMPVFMVLSLPIVDYAASRWLPSWSSILARLTPADGGFSLARAAYESVPGSSLAWGILSTLLWAGSISVLFLGPAVAAARGD